MRVLLGAAATFNAADVREALLRRWPPAEYLSIPEAPDSPDRQGRKLDLLVVSLWRSRGHELDGVEIKCSKRDWQRELTEPAKADWWWSRVHRFWIAAPAPVATQIELEIPKGWGLIACDDNGTTVRIKPEKHDARPLLWPECVGLLRAASDVGPSTLHRAHQQGWDLGCKAGERQAQIASGDASLRSELERLRLAVSRFEEASGLPISDQYRADRLGKMAKALLPLMDDGRYLVSQLERTARNLREAADKAETGAAALSAHVGDIA